MGVAAWRPDFAFQVAFNADPNDPAAVPSWTDLTARLRTANSVTRGRQYELDTNLAAQVSVTLDDPDEYLNPANGSSPYSPNVVPYRQVLWQGVWPNPASGNHLNTKVGANPQLGTTSAGYDPSFESYNNGATAPWVTAVGSTAPTVTTTNPQQGSQDLTWTVANGATVQGVSIVVPCIPGRQYTTSAYVRQSSASTQQISIVSGATGTNTTTTGAYVRLSVTFTATQPTHTMQLATTGTAVAGTVNFDAVQHEQAASASAFTTTGSVIYGIFRGYVERWPSAWDHGGFRGRCEAILVDGLATLNLIALSSEVINSLSTKKPDFWWRLNEPTGATKFAEDSGNSGPLLVRFDSPYGAAPTFAAGTATNIAGDPSGTGLALSGPNGNTNTPASIVQAGYQNTPPFTSFPSAVALPVSFTSAFWCARTTTINTGRMMMLSSGFGGINYQLIDWAAQQATPNINYASSVDANGHFVSCHNSSDPYADGKPHLYVGVTTITSSTATATMYVDGVQIATNTVSSVGWPAPPWGMTNIQVGSRFNLQDFFESNLPGAVYAHVALWNRALSAAEITDLANAGKGYTGETSGARITRYLSYGWTGTTSIDTGLSVMGVSGLTAPSTPSGATSTLTGCQNTTTSENGNFWVDSGGNVTFASRSRRYNVLTSQYVFGENTAGGEFPYEEGIGYGLDPTQVYNAIEVDNLGGVKTVVTDATSQKKNFPHSYQLSVNVSDNEAIDHANWILSTHKTPQQRLEAIGLEPGSKGTTHWPVVLGLEVGQRVTVKRRPSGANSGTGLTMSGDFFVEQINHSSIDMEAGMWLTILLLSPAFRAQVWILGDATYGVLNTSTILAF